jgi:hypothetical protein
MNLESVGKLVAQHSATPAAMQTKTQRAELEQTIVRKMVNSIFWGMIILGIGVAMLVVNQTFDIGKWFSLLSVLFMFGGIGVATAGVLNSIRQGAGISGARSSTQLNGAVGTKSLPTTRIPEALPSVTEQTTQLIGGSESKNKMRDTNGGQ